MGRGGMDYKKLEKVLTDVRNSGLRQLLCVVRTRV